MTKWLETIKKEINLENGTPGIKPYDFVPYLYYADAMEGKDIFGEEIEPSI